VLGGCGGLSKQAITGCKIVHLILNRATDYGTVLLRMALGISFLSAVADRFGLWGAYGQPNVAWGDFSRFVASTGRLNWFAPTTVTPALAWAATFVWCKRFSVNFGAAPLSTDRVAQR
jgi:hypothetical protein